MTPEVTPGIQLTEDQKKMALRVIKIAVVVVPVLGGGLAALITGSPFDWLHAIQVVLPALVGDQ